MTRYLDITREVAARVISGELEPGTELPSIRELAEHHETAASTVSRAYRHLADAGVIAQSARRRARIAPDATLAARRMVAAGREFRLAGSDDPALDLVLRQAGPGVRTVGTRGSFKASPPCGAAPPTEPRSTYCTTQASITPPTRPRYYVGANRPLSTSGAANKGSSSRRETQARSPASRTYAISASPNANSAPAPASCSIDYSKTPGSRPTQCLAPKPNRTSRSRSPSPPASPTPGWAFAQQQEHWTSISCP